MKLFQHTLRQVDWLFLDMNSYFASVEQHLNPELRGRPVAVVPCETDATCAIAASYEAKRYGIKTGTKIYEAKKMCPDLVCIKADHSRYVYYHHRFLQSINKHIPVQGRYIVSIDELACRITGRERDIGSAIALAERIKAGLARDIGESIRCSIGISSNRFLAKTATKLEKPDGLVVLMPDTLPHSLNGLELGDLYGIGSGMLARLHEAGIYSIPALYRLTEQQMHQIWGSVGGLQYWQKLRGIELADKETTRRTVGHSHVLDPLWRPVGKTRYVAKRLTLKAASRLRRLGYYATRLDISLRLEHGPRIGATVSFDAACDNHTLVHALNTGWGHLLQAHHPVRVKKVAVTLYGLTEQKPPQMQLFTEWRMHEAYKERCERISRTMDDLNSKFGRDTVTMGALPKENLSFSGTKIAFDRIPDIEEFHE